MSDSTFFKVVVATLLVMFAMFVVAVILVPRPHAQECKNPQTIMTNMVLPDGSISLSSTQVCE